VGIDEAQFFDPEIVDVLNTLANNGLRVIVAGLDMDSEGRPFGPMPQLLAVAEFVTKLHAVCVHTGGPAHFSHRKQGLHGGQVLLGGTESYEPLSRAAFIAARKAEADAQLAESETTPSERAS
jgi:thymidine kinase